MIFFLFYFFEKFLNKNSLFFAVRCGGVGVGGGGGVGGWLVGWLNR